MKLLSIKQTKQIEEVNRSVDIMRMQELNKAADIARKNLAEAEADFNATLARNRERWAQEEAEHVSRTHEMEQEIYTLENRKKASLESNQDDLEALAEKLQDKLDAVGEKEQDLIQFEKTLLLRQESIEIQRKLLSPSPKAT